MLCITHFGNQCCLRAQSSDIQTFWYQDPLYMLKKIKEDSLKAFVFVAYIY